MIQPFWDMQEEEILIRLKAMWAQGKLTYDRETEKFRCNVDMDLDGPYLFLNPELARADCILWWDIMFQTFGITAPSHCQQFCWKIVIDFRNVKDLFLGFEMLRETGFHGKAGYDPRHYTPGCWKGFVYNQDKETAWDRLDQTREELSDLDPSYKDRVFLKRGCTEFELKCPSDKWCISPQQMKLEHKILRFVHPVGNITVPQPEWLERKLFRKWLREAHAHGDHSYVDLPERFTADVRLPAPPVKYEREHGA